MRNACSLLAMVTAGATILAAAEPATAQALYSAKLNAQAKLALEEYTALRKSQVAELDARIAEIDTEEAALKAAIRARGQVQRDLAVVRALEPKGAAERDKQLIAVSDARFNTITEESISGFVANKNAINLLYPIRPDAMATSITPDANANRAVFTRYLTGGTESGAAFLQQPLGGKAAPQGGWTLDKFCKAFQNNIDSGNLRSALGAGDGSDRWQGFIALMRIQGHDRCAPFQKNAVDVTGLSPQLRFLATGKPSGDQKDPGPTGKMLRILDWQAQGLAERLVTIKKQQEAANADAKTLSDDLACLQTHWSSNRPEKSLQSIAAAITATASGKPLPVDSPPVEFAAGSTDAAIQQCRIDAEQARAKEKQVTEDEMAKLSVGEIIAQAEAIAEVGDAMDSLRAGPLYEIFGYLADPTKAREAADKDCRPLAAAVVGATPATPEQNRLCATLAVVDSLNLIDRGAKIKEGYPGAIAALKVRLPAAQLQADLLRSQAAALAAQSANVEARRKAILAELGLLMKAWQNAAPADGAPGVKMRTLKLARSFDKGRLPQEELAAVYPMIALRGWTERERLTLKARHEIADAGLAILIESSASGLKPEEISSFLTAFGVGKIALFGGAN
jgi:hypothetical protein